MHTNHLLFILTYLIIFTVDSIPSKHLNKLHSRFRRREFVQDEVRKNMLNYMTSLKGEITDIVIEEMIDYYNRQTSKLYNLEKELLNIKNLSLPVLSMSKQQHSFALNISFMENKIKNLTMILNDLLQQQKPVEYVKRVIENKKLPIDCDEIFHQQSSIIHEGIFRIKPRFSSESFDVKCIFENNIGWTVIQQRINGTVDFYRGWKEYKNGFGNLQTEFWLGNEKIHQLTNQGKYILRIDLKPWNNLTHIAEYGQFSLDTEKQNYKLSISDFNSNISTAGDSLSSSWNNANQTSFSTFDHDYDNLFYDNCALIYHGAWWFTNCFQSHLNGAYIHSPLALQNIPRNGIHWNTYDLYHSMKESTMRIRRRN